MKIIDRAIQYGKIYSNPLDRKIGFIHGAEWIKDEITIFISANPKATAKQIIEYLKTL